MPSDVFVLVPSYNHAPFIEKCLRSIIEQTAEPRKLLVIDDGSSDGSVEIIERVLRDCRFESEFIVRENRGLCRTLNEGLERSEGKYFAYLGSDDYWLHDFLKLRVELLERRPRAVLAYGHSYIVDEENRITDSTENHSDTWAYYPDGDPGPMLLNGGAPISSSVCYRRSGLDGLEWNESARLEDYEMYLRLMAKGEFAFDSRVLCAWRSHSYNTSGSRTMMLEEIMAAQERTFAALGLGDEALAAAKTRTRFLYARIALQHGDKLTAMRLARGNWKGARSTMEKAAFAARMLTPMPIVKMKRLRDRKKIHKH
jgi:alpha-1,3-rhamnosyltransferase